MSLENTSYSYDSEKTSEELAQEGLKRLNEIREERHLNRVGYCEQLESEAEVIARYEDKSDPDKLIFVDADITPEQCVESSCQSGSSQLLDPLLMQIGIGEIDRGSENVVVILCAFTKYQSEIIEGLKQTALMRINELRSKSGLSRVMLNEGLCYKATTELKHHKKIFKEYEHTGLYSGHNLTGSKCMERWWTEQGAFAKSDAFTRFGIGYWLDAGIPWVQVIAMDYSKMISEGMDSLNEIRMSFKKSSVSLCEELSESAQLMANLTGVRDEKNLVFLQYGITPKSCVIYSCKDLSSKLLDKKLNRIGVGIYENAMVTAIVFTCGYKTLTETVPTTRIRKLIKVLEIQEEKN